MEGEKNGVNTAEFILQTSDLFKVVSVVFRRY